MAGTQPVEYDAQGKPLPASNSPAPEYDAGGKPIAPAASPSSAALFGADGNPGVIDKMKANFNSNTQGAQPGDGTLLGALHNFTAGGGDVIRAAAHPIRTAESMLAPPTPSTDPGMIGKAENLSDVLTPPGMPSLHSVMDMGNNLIHQPARTLGQIGTSAILGEGVGRAIGAGAEAASAARNAAIGDPNAAAVRGLKVPPGSPKMQRTISNVETARPYLQGVKSQAELQTRVPQAKAEIWGPYQQAVDTGKNVQVAGPDGPTTIGQLEQERLQLSALNRGLKMREPEAIQLAQQKGMNQAQLLAREKAIQGALDPELTKMGIKPQEIRKTFGSVAQIGQKVSGKSNIIEPEQPYGFSKLKDISLTKPLSNIPTILSAGRDIAAGRYLSASPIDTGIREGFRTAGPKPDLGRLTSTLQPPPPRALLGPGARPMPAPAYDGRVAGYESPPVYAGTDASRLGRLLPADIPARELPLSSYHEIFPDQIHQARVLDYIRRSQ